MYFTLSLPKAETINPQADLGKFGMGLVTASLSMCTRLEVITRRKGEPILHSIQDVKVIEETNEFVKYLDQAADEVQLEFESKVGGAESGTIVRLANCDRLSNKNTTAFANTLRKGLGQTYRYFLRPSGALQMSVNGHNVDPTDPLMLNEGSEVQLDTNEEISYVSEDGTEHKDSLRVRVVTLPDFGADGNRDRGINIPNQGIYVLRNFREIAEGQSLGLFTKHNDYNRLRIELLFPGTLDGVMGVDVAKQRIELTQSVDNKLRQRLTSLLSSLRSRLKKKIEAESPVSHDEAARLIGQKAHLLAKPKQEVEQRLSQFPVTKDDQREIIGSENVKTSPKRIPNLGLCHAGSKLPQ